MDLDHDAVLVPIDSTLRSQGFDVGVPETASLRADLVGVRGGRAVVVEAKTIGRGATGRNEAREAFGQVHEYGWLLGKRGIRGDEQLRWIAFDRRPDADVVEFLEDHDLIVSWPDTGTFDCSSKSRRRLNSWVAEGS